MTENNKQKSPELDKYTHKIIIWPKKSKTNIRNKNENKDKNTDAHKQ